VQARDQDRVAPPPGPPVGDGTDVAVADACPGLLDLHQARDGLVARIRLPGGYVSAARLRSLAALASRFGDGQVDLTARGNVQLRGVQPGAAAGLGQRAAAAGFLPSPAHDRARNIVASPLAGLAGHPDLRGLVRSLDRAIRADPALAALPGRFLFSVDDGTGRAALGACDVGLRWQPGGVELIVAGRRTGVSGPAARQIRLAIAAARAFLDQRLTAGDVVDQRPTAGGPLDQRAAAARAVSPGVAGPRSTRVARLPDGGTAVAAAVGGVLGERVADTTGRLALGPVSGTGPAGPAVVVAAPLGRLTAAQVRLIAGMVGPAGTVRLSPAGRIVLPLAEPAPTALARLAGAGLLARDDHPLAAVTACAGLGCASALADVRALATAVPGLAAVHWAGCGRGCGRPADATAVVATPAGQFTLDDGTPVLAGPTGQFRLGDAPGGRALAVAGRPA
jgi:precorrin-3B synthase